MSILKNITLPLAALTALILSAESAALTIKYNENSIDSNGIYAATMLKLALDHVDAKKYQLVAVPGNLTQVRMVEDTLSGALDVTWAASNKDLEAQLEPIRIPLYKGLLGHRILIIRNGDQPKFDKVKTLDDLNKIKFGQGTAWSDTQILEANGLNVIKTMKYQNLFYMLDGSRFDAFPRAVFEPYGEIEKHPNLNLAIEKNLMLVYKMDFYLFVNKNNTSLANDLEIGLNRAIADGSFDKLFFSAESVREAMAKGDLKNRTIINLDNPFNSKETPIDRKELWLDTQSLK